MKVLLVFKAYGEGDSYRADELLGVCKNKTSVEKLIKQHNPFNGVTRPTDVYVVHKSMNKENNYTYYGKRDYCDINCSYACFGGYIVEEVKLR